MGWILAALYPTPGAAEVNGAATAAESLTGASAGTPLEELGAPPPLGKPNSMAQALR